MGISPEDEQTEIERRLGLRLAMARRELLKTFEGTEPGDGRAVRRQPSILAELLGIEGQLLSERARRIEAEADEADKDEAKELRNEAKELRKRARQASADALDWQAESRRGFDRKLFERVEHLEAELFRSTLVAEEMAKL